MCEQVPYTGIASLHPIMDHTGPMARTIEDTALLLGVLAGYDGMDPRMTPETPLRSQVPNYLDDLQSWVTRPMIPHFLSAKPLELLSHTMPHLDPIPMGQKVYDTLANRNAAPVNMAMNAVQMEQRYGNRLARKAYMHIFELRAAYDKAFEEVDVLLTPMTPTVGPKIPFGAIKTAENPHGLSDRLMDLFEPIIGNTLNTAPFNVSGHPAMSMPVGWGTVKDGEGRLPVGMQLVAKRWDEASLFKAAKAWEVGGKWMDTT